MAKATVRQLPLKLRAGRKTDVRAQFAALCWRMKNGELQICLVTSRTRKRWIIPKGWPMHKQTPALAAATEAYEEAGVSGTASDMCLGAYSYVKPLKTGEAPVLTMVYPLHVQHVHSNWPEKHQRKRKWFSAKKAAKKLSEPELRQIVATFSPGKLAD
ncbi:NUDIX hydrolase [Yoonia sediminilitoris]|uniref:8-oxo-dGTP pyrophosphatase MutT (NUDIX family) n=1 Tax=Yoonia sediminilitoris TaxID=1286148 RepID=A0A2T6KJZ6_9RHOB|nr:NUDIX hydrolase [Yoonia sediminilitoris]PUB16284.1 8-oxo-dGTP pyrophosphatase MutT (NUDIX family) [Yoonia sediminilitoris]RCW96633.1 8-oxo-dGTP pyrophosphatase MutT (NUDIX family) [Yoonia sediminilitoris]